MESIALASNDASDEIKVGKKANRDTSFTLPEFSDAAEKAYALDGYLRPFESVHRARYTVKI